MKQFQRKMLVTLVGGALLSIGGALHAQELRVQCYDDSNECEVTADFAKRFEAANAGVKIVIDKVPYKAVREQLPVQLAAGEGPDIARVTSVGALNEYYLDISPYLDAKRQKYWNDSFASTIDWFRTDAEKASGKGIHGFMTQLTVSGPFVNKTLFEQANVPIPAAGATWDDWAAATKKVAEATKTPFAIAVDRSGHRFIAFASSYGAKLFDSKGQLVIDDGYKTAVKKFVEWHKNGIMPKEVWGGVGGSQYKDAFEEFANGRVVMYYSGSWQIRRMDSQVSKSFDWAVGAAPCGPANCTPMVGGAAYVAFKRTKHPELVAKFIDFMAQEANYAEFTMRTENIPAHLGVAKAGVAYKASPASVAALNRLVAEVPKINPAASKLAGYALADAIYAPTVQRTGQAIAGELSVEDALKRIEADMTAQVKGSKK